MVLIPLKCVESLRKIWGKEFKFSLLWSPSQKSQQTHDGLLILTEKLCLPNVYPVSQRKFLFSHFPLSLTYSPLPIPPSPRGRALLSTTYSMPTLAEECNPQLQGHSWLQGWPNTIGRARTRNCSLNAHRKNRKGESEVSAKLENPSQDSYAKWRHKNEPLC